MDSWDEHVAEMDLDAEIQEAQDNVWHGKEPTYNTGYMLALLREIKRLRMERREQPMSSEDKLHICRAPDDAPCDIHDWPTEGLPQRLVQAMRDTHPVGLNACRACLQRAFDERDRMRPVTDTIIAVAKAVSVESKDCPVHLWSANEVVKYMHRMSDTIPGRTKLCRECRLRAIEASEKEPTDDR